MLGALDDWRWECGLDGWWRGTRNGNCHAIIRANHAGPGLVCITHHYNETHDCSVEDAMRTLEVVYRLTP